MQYKNTKLTSHKLYQ